MRLNGYDLVDRNNHPNMTGRVAIRVFFMNDGHYIDPVEIVDVTIFPRAAYQYPSSLMDDSNLLDDANVSALCTAHFAASTGTYYPPEEYSPGASGVFRISQGEYVVVLDGITDVSSYAERWDTVVTNTTSSIGDYLDVWTIKYPTGSDYQTVINSFTLYDDIFYTTTEPLLLRTFNHLITKKIPLGARQDIKITTEFVVENRNIDNSIRNLFKSAIAVNPQIKITKINEDPNISSRVEVSGWSDTSSLIKVDSANTFILTWDTDELRTHPEMLTGEFGHMRGVYSIQVRYSLLNELIYSPQMYLQVV